MNQVMYAVDEVSALIKEGKSLILAGDERTLKKLPKGNWIGGSIPYFLDVDGGKFTRDHIYVTQVPEFASKSTVKVYSPESISEVYNDAPQNGFSFIILPAFSSIHASFALESPTYQNFACSPLIGWISGTALDDLDYAKPKTFDGISASEHQNKAVVFHVELPANKAADIQIINLMEQGDGDIITFPQSGFHASDALINGEKMDFATYLNDRDIDTKLPLVADMHGAMINTSFQAIDVENRQVDFYAPVFDGVTYKIAKPVAHYINSFKECVPNGLEDRIYFSCNCILNYLYASLEGKSLKQVTGPITFGEIAYQLLNQTMVYMTIEDI